VNHGTTGTWPGEPPKQHAARAGLPQQFSCGASVLFSEDLALVGDRADPDISVKTGPGSFLEELAVLVGGV